MFFEQCVENGPEHVDEHQDDVLEVGEGVLGLHKARAAVARAGG